MVSARKSSRKKWKLSLLFLLSAQAAFAKPPLEVLATFPSLADIAAQVGGADVRVTTLAPEGENPRFVELSPTPQLTALFKRAQLMVRTGLGLEEAWLPPMVISSGNDAIQQKGPGDFDASRFVKILDVPAPLPGTQSVALGDAHFDGNPHFLLDPRNGALVARGLAEELAKVDPAHAKDYRARAGAFAARLAARLGRWQAALKPLAGQRVVCFHRAWTYFFAWLGIQDAGEIEPAPGFRLNADSASALIQSMRAKKVASIWLERQDPRETAEFVARQTGARIWVLPSEAGRSGYLAFFDDLVAQLIHGKPLELSKPKPISVRHRVTTTGGAPSPGPSPSATPSGRTDSDPHLKYLNPSAI